MNWGTSMRSGGLVLVLAVVLASLSSGARSINHIMADPSRYSDKNVRVEGQVTESYSVLGNGAYQIDDGTGKLRVVSTKGVPRKGARVSTKGKIKDGFDVGSLVTLPKELDSGLVMIESSHKAED